MSFRDHFEVYEFDCILPGTGEKIYFKPLTTKEIKKLLTYEDSADYTEIEKILDKVIESSVTNEDFNIDNLYLQDRFFLVTEIRKKSKGEVYEFQYNCPNCKSENYLTANLDNLTINKLQPDQIDNKIEIANKENVSIFIWFIRRGEEKEAHELTDKSENNTRREAELQLNTLTQGIKGVETPDGIDEDLTFEDKQFVMNSLSLKDLDSIRNWYRDNNFGVDFTITKTCRQCGYEERTSIPLANFFF